MWVGMAVLAAGIVLLNMVTAVLNHIMPRTSSLLSFLLPWRCLPSTSLHGRPRPLLRRGVTGLMCDAALHKQAAVLSEETLQEREAALNGEAQRAKGPRSARSPGSSKAASAQGSALDSTYNLGVAAGLISETQAASRAHSAAAPRLNSSRWNDRTARGRCEISATPCNFPSIPEDDGLT